MKTKTLIQFLKNILPFWQEIIFTITILFIIAGNLLSGPWTKEVFIFDGIFLSIAICLIGQLFWKTKILSGILAFVIAICSFYMTLAAMSEFHELPENATSARQGLGIAMLVFLGLVVIAISMPFKYYYGRFNNDNKEDVVESCIELQSSIDQ